MSNKINLLSNSNIYNTITESIQLKIDMKYDYVKEMREGEQKRDSTLEKQ